MLKLAYLIRSFSRLWLSSAAGLVLFYGTFCSFAAETAIATLVCTDAERWVYGPALEQDVSLSFRREFEQFLQNKSSAVRSFAEALALRRLSLTVGSKIFSEYWISRSLYRAGLIEIAASGFNAIAGKPPTPSTVGIQIAALACLERIHALHSTIDFAPQVRAQISTYFGSAVVKPEFLPILWEAVLQIFQRQIGSEVGSDSKDSEGAALVRLVRGGGPYERYLKAILAIRQGKAREAAGHLEALIIADRLPASIRAQKDTIRLLLARTYYTSGRYEEAAAQLGKIDKNSNELIHALSEMAWAHLLAGRYTDAIGVGIGVQSGWVRRTFSPEAMMVMAMALNEICQYPESVKLIGMFRNEYGSSFEWLKREARSNGSPLYPLAVASLRDGKKVVPDRVASEWMRSPLFIANQGGINLIFEENRAANAMGAMGQKEQALQAKMLLKATQDLRKKFPRDKNDWIQLQSQVAHYRRLASAAPIWRNILGGYLRGVVGVRARLVDEIEQELTQLNARMLHQLVEVAENSDLIEVEIYDGASEDIIWQNAHPEYKAMQPGGGAQSARSLASSPDVYNWGASLSGLTGTGELWEDEIGSLKANLADNCASKEKYVDVQRE